MTLLERASDAAGPGEEALIKEARRLRRKRWMIGSTLVALSVAAGFAGFIAASGSPSASHRAAASGTGSFAGAARSSCRSAQLAARIGRVGAAAGSVGIAVELRNVSPTRCTLDGRPTLRLVNSNGTLMPTSRGIATTVPRLPTRVVSLPPGGIAYFVIGFADRTGFAYGCPTSARALLFPPHDQTAIDVPWRLGPFGGINDRRGCGALAISAVISKDTVTLPPAPWRKAAISTRWG